MAIDWDHIPVHAETKRKVKQIKGGATYDDAISSFVNQYHAKRRENQS